MKIRSPLSYKGGKFYLTKEILSLIDYQRKCYIELFFGAGQVFFAKAPHPVEIINDIDNDLINFYLVWRDQKDKFIDYLDKMPYSRSLFKNIVDNWFNGNKGKDDFERAVNYFYILRSAFLSKMGKTWSWSYLRNDASTFRSSIELLNILYHRIKNAQIENQDFRKILAGIKKDYEKEIIIYADPPYFGRKYYTNSFSLKDHIDLADYLNNLSDCKIILSYNDHPLLQELYPKDKWTYLEFSKISPSKVYNIRVVKNDEEQDIRSKELLLINFRKGGEICSGNLFSQWF